MREAGLYPDIPEHIYHSWPGASASRLRDMLRSPAHCHHAMMEHRDPTDAMRLGAAIHAAILQPEIFEKEWGTIPSGMRRDLRISDFKKLADEFGYDKLLKPEELKIVDDVSEAVLKHDAAASLLAARTHTELSGVWYDDGSTVPRKMRVDGVCQDLGIFFDIKTTPDASLSAFTSVIAEYGYQRQGALYRHGLRKLGIDCQHFMLIAVEKTGLIGVAAYRLTNEALMAGEIEVNRLLKQFDECFLSAEWPCYPQVPQDISIPSWELNRINQLTAEA